MCVCVCVCVLLGSVLISLFTCSCPVFPASLIEETVFSLLYILASFVKDWPWFCEFISGLPILFHWFTFLFLHQYHTILITVAMKYSLRSGSLVPLALFFFFFFLKTWKQAKCSLTEKWVKKMWHIHVMEYYSVIKKNENILL